MAREKGLKNLLNIMSYLDLTLPFACGREEHSKHELYHSHLQPKINLMQTAKNVSGVDIGAVKKDRKLFLKS